MANKRCKYIQSRQKHWKHMKLWARSSFASKVRVEDLGTKMKQTQIKERRHRGFSLVYLSLNWKLYKLKSSVRFPHRSLLHYAFFNYTISFFEHKKYFPVYYTTQDSFSMHNEAGTCTEILPNLFHKVVYILLAVSWLGRITGPVSSFLMHHFVALCPVKNRFYLVHPEKTTQNIW